MPKFNIVIHKNAEKELLELPNELKGKMALLISKLEEGIQLKMPVSKSLGGGLFELRVIEKNNIARTIFVYQKMDVIFLLHTVVKKSQKTPLNSLKIARARLKELIYE